MVIATINCLAHLRFNRLINASIKDIQGMIIDLKNVENLQVQLKFTSTLADFVLIGIYIVMVSVVVSVIFRHNKK
jgi:cytochrome c biogenesis protein ResB